MPIDRFSFRNITGTLVPTETISSDSVAARLPPRVDGGTSMAKSLARVTILLVLCGGTALRGLAAATPVTALRASELLGLVAGGAPHDSVVREIASDGLSFRPNDSYRAQ